MFWNNSKKWVVVAALTAAIAGALPLFGQTGGLIGDAKDDKGNPIVGAAVVIERQDIKGIYKTKTDKKGHYIYVGLPIGNYKITFLEPSGRELYHFGGVHVGLGDPTPRDLDMATEKAAAVKEQQASPEYQKQMEEQQKTEKQFTDLKGLFGHGNELYDQKQYAEAAAEFEKALPLAKDKNMVAVESRLGDSYAGAREYDKAVDNFQKAIALDPSNASLHNALGSTYAKMNKITEAQAEFQKSAELNPAGAAVAYYNLGAIMTNTGKLDEAAAAFKKATEIDPKYADAYFLEAQALLGKATTGADGKVVPAPGTVEALQQYITLDPNGKYAASAQAMLQSLTGSVQTEYKSDKKKKK